MFKEIRPKKDAADERPKTVQGYAIQVEPKQCSSIVKQLAVELPLGEDLSHLKRVRNPQQRVFRDNIKKNNKNSEQNDDDDSSSSSPKTKKTKLMLQVLLGTNEMMITPSLLEKLGGGCGGEQQQQQTKQGLGVIEEVTVPGRPPKSNDEWKEMNRIWPTTYLPLNTEEHQEEILALTQEEIVQMEEIMEKEVLATAAVATTTTTTAAAAAVTSLPRVVIVDPSNGTVVSRSDDEEKLQLSSSLVDGDNNNDNNNSTDKNDSSIGICNNNNPLATQILFALQGVSRKERQASTVLSSEEFTKGQYLCTGYDMYTYYQPTVFEAMASLHHRIRRVIYYENTAENEDDEDEESKTNISNLPPKSVLTRGFSKHFIHCLPGTNHRFRVFEYKRKRKVSK